MDLISREDIINIATSSCLDLDSYDDTDEFCDEIKELPSAFEGMTNGEVLKSIFPTAELLLGNSEHIPNVLSVKEDWWNEPYKTESEGTE